MSSLALIEVQHALWNKLHGDGVLMGMVSGIYDAVPQRVALPYVTIGDGKSRMLPADSLPVTEIVLQLEIWTDANARKPVLTIMNRLYALLHLGTLTLSGFQQVTLRCEQADTVVAEQSTRIQGTLQLRVTMVEA